MTMNIYGNMCQNLALQTITLEVVACTKHIQIINQQKNYYIGSPRITFLLQEYFPSTQSKCNGVTTLVYKTKDGVSKPLDGYGSRYTQANESIAIGTSGPTDTGKYQFFVTHEKLPSNLQLVVTVIFIYQSNQYYGLLPISYLKTFTNSHQCTSCNKALDYSMKIQLFDSKDESNCLNEDFSTNIIVRLGQYVTVFYNLNEELFKNMIRVQIYYKDYVVEETHIRTTSCCNYIFSRGTEIIYNFLGFPKPTLPFQPFEINPQYHMYSESCSVSETNVLFIDHSIPLLSSQANLDLLSDVYLGKVDESETQLNYTTAICKDPYYSATVINIDCTIQGRVIVPEVQPNVTLYRGFGQQSKQMNAFQVSESRYLPCLKGNSGIQFFQQFQNKFIKSHQENLYSTFKFDLESGLLTISPTLNEQPLLGIYKMSVQTGIHELETPFETSFYIKIIDPSECIVNQTYEICSPTLKLKLPPYTNQQNLSCQELDQATVKVAYQNSYFEKSFQMRNDLNEVWVNTCDYNAMGIYFFEVTPTEAGGRPIISQKKMWQINLQGNPPCYCYFSKTYDSILTTSNTALYDYHFSTSHKYRVCKEFKFTFSLESLQLPKIVQSQSTFLLDSSSQLLRIYPSSNVLPQNEWLELKIVANDEINSTLIIKLFVKHVQTSAEIFLEDYLKQHSKLSLEDQIFYQIDKPLDEQIQETEEFDPSIVYNPSLRDKILGINGQKIKFYNVSIESISQNGVLTLEFEKSLRFSSQSFQDFIKAKVLAVKYFQSYANRLYSVTLAGWNITRFTERKIEIQLQFNNSLQVSFSKLDMISVRILNKVALISQDLQSIPGEEIFLYSGIPPQLDGSGQYYRLFTLTIDLSANLETTAALSQEVIRYSVISIFVLRILFSASMRYIWNLLSTLQIITHFTLLAVKFPEIYVQVNKSIVEIANGNVIPNEYVTFIKKHIQKIIGSSSQTLYDKAQFNQDISSYKLTQIDIFQLFIDFLVYLTFSSYGTPGFWNRLGFLVFALIGLLILAISLGLILWNVKKFPKYHYPFQ